MSASVMHRDKNGLHAYWPVEPGADYEQQQRLACSACVVATVEARESNTVHALATEPERSNWHVLPQDHPRLAGLDVALYFWPDGFRRAPPAAIKAGLTPFP